MTLNGFSRSAVFASADGVTSPMTLSVSGTHFSSQLGVAGDCCICCYGYCGFFITDSPTGTTPSPITTTVGQGAQAYAKAYYTDGSVHDFTTASTWISMNTAVATVQTTGQTSPGLVTGVAGGSATITASDSPDGQGVHAVGCGGCPGPQNMMATATANVVWVTLSLQTSGPVASDNAAKSLFESIINNQNLGTLFDSESYWVTAVQITGSVQPSTYTGTILLHRQKTGGAVYDNCTLEFNIPSGDDSSSYLLEDQDPQSGGSAGKVYDLDEPGIHPGSQDHVGDVYHFRVNVYEYATATINGASTTVSSNLNWFSRISYTKTTGGSQLSYADTGDNMAATGTTKTSCNLQ